MRKPRSIDDYPIPYVFLGVFMVYAFGNLFYPSEYLILYGGFFAGMIISFIVRKGMKKEVAA